MKNFESVRIFHQYAKLPVPHNRIKTIAAEIYKDEKIKPGRYTDVIFCSDYMIRKLNATYRDIDRVTDVLSFPFGDPDFLGEIYISLQKTRRQAKQFKISYDDEIIRLFVHGMFHLLGYDHGTDFQRQRMEKKESKYITTRYES